MSFRWLPLAAFLLASFAPALSAAEFPDAAQPQLATTADGRVYLAYGRGPEIFVARSDDAGATYANIERSCHANHCRSGPQSPCRCGPMRLRRTLGSEKNHSKQIVRRSK